MGTGKTIALHSAMDKGGGTEDLYIVRADLVTGDAGTSYIVDKTDEEILAAFESGKLLVCDVYDQGYFQNRYFLQNAENQDLDDDGIRESFRFHFFAFEPKTEILQFTIETWYMPDAQKAVRNVYRSEFICVSEDSIPIKLPNPEPVTFIDHSGNETVYDGQTPVTIRQNPDWSAVAGKPFRSELLLPETPFDAAEIEERLLLTTPFVLEEGADYIVTINGIRFECVCTRLAEEDSLVIGNTGALFGETPNDLPFAILCTPDGEETDKGVISYGAYVPVIVKEEHLPYAAGTFSIMRKDREGAFLNADALPVMSATEKGGARVGAGLVMDGDVLRMDRESIAQQVTAALSSCLGDMYALRTDVDRILEALGMTGTVTPEPDVFFAPSAEGSVQINDVAFVKFDDDGVLMNGAEFEAQTDGTILIK